MFIVGGGNSLKNFDFKLLHGRCVIALNSAYKYVDENSALYWADSNWGATWEDRGLADHPSKFKFTSRTQISPAMLASSRGVAGSHYLNLTGNSGYDPNPDHVRGTNSGGHAINLAVNMNAQRIILLGFDMGYVFGRSHFHSDHEHAVGASTYTEVFIPSINSLSSAIKHLPVEVINCSFTSNLKCFKTGDIKDYL
ncbi:hypothetical protein Xoosp13_335 [Xanthomonas phage Xoo-sp13]|nr:hypothetical protein Xoosp13_335 [Xanthomonas phage Xoo-sp13]